MPIYFFHLLNETYSAEDTDGQELPDDDAAKAEAARTAGGILTSDLANEHGHAAFTIYVDRADGTRLLTLPVVALVSPAADAQPGGLPG